jgi:hypothetical protein
MSQSRTQIAAIAKANQKRLAAINGRDPATALSRLSAREIFTEATARREASRPTITERVQIGTDKLGRKITKAVERKGEATFRNAIDRTTGAWV